MRTRTFPQLQCLVAAFLWMTRVSGASNTETSLPPVRVALMDFSTDDNSYRNWQLASDFTKFLQSQAARQPGVEWVERAQLRLADQELHLSEMERISGMRPLRRGKWLKADWEVRGHFSLDDQDQRSLLLEIMDLQHADVLATRLLKFADTAAIEPAGKQVEVAATALTELLSQARRYQQQMASRVLVAPLFLVNLDPFHLGADDQLLEREFDDALERAALTNERLRLIHFPKAHQALGEAEMVLNGLVEADLNAWQHTADLYVWGICTHSNVLSAGGSRSLLNITLHTWDGSSKPKDFREEIATDPFSVPSAKTTSGALDRLVAQVVVQARKPAIQTDSLASRRQIAASLLQTYQQMSGPTPGNLALHDTSKFLQAVRMLETACFFDPDNAEAHVMRITCRWGWWMEFRDEVKNPFWSVWRRSQAWGRYVERFGLGPVAVKLPFPYERDGIPGLYVKSAKDVLEMFPSRLTTAEESTNSHIWSPLKEAQAHGFPKDIPNEAILAWKEQIQNELAQRRNKADAQSALTGQNNNAPRMALTNRSATVTSLPSPPIPTAPARAPAVAAPNSPVPPAWIREIKPMFGLQPPPVLPIQLELEPQGIAFPAQFDVQGVLQVTPLQGRLLILATDERSAPSTDPDADLAAELRSRRGRLWELDPDGQSPVLFEKTVIPDGINSFLAQPERVWVAGGVTGCFDLRSHTFRRYGLADGLASGPALAFALSGPYVLAAADSFTIYRLDSNASGWEPLPFRNIRTNTVPSDGKALSAQQHLTLPGLRLSASSSNPSLLAGNGKWVCYVAGSSLCCEPSVGRWKILPELTSVQCLAGDSTGFWCGSRQGLDFYEPDRASLQSWHAPAGIGPHFKAFPMENNLYTFGPLGPMGDRPGELLAALEKRVQRSLKNLQEERARIQAARALQEANMDPLHLDFHVPAEINRLAADGDYLWIGAGDSVFLMHKPSQSMIACGRVAGHITCLGVSDKWVWVGTAYGQTLLYRIPKEPFMAVPQKDWTPISINSTERARLIAAMGIHEQALYAFFSGDDAKASELLGRIVPEKATLEEMFLLAFIHDASGLDKPDVARAWLERIISRVPDSPWAAQAREFLAENEQRRQAKERESSLLAKYDLNHDGVLDAQERKAMEKDPAFQREQKMFNEDQLDLQLPEILKKYDQNNDGKLDKDELEQLSSAVRVYSEMPPQMLAGRKVVVAPLLSRNFPSTTQILRMYDGNGDGALDLNELKHLAHDIQSAR